MNGVGAFLDSILADPESDGPRLVYADWLEELGDPLGEFIRVQCELAQLKRDDARRASLQEHEHELRTVHSARWMEPLHALGFGGRFRRGMLELSVNGIQAFLAHAGLLMALPWVLHVNLRDAKADQERLTQLGRSPYLARVASLDLSRSQFGNAGLDLLFRLKGQCRPTALNLSNNLISSYGIRSMLTGIDPTQLEELKLAGNGIGEQGALDLSRYAGFARLRRLDLSYNHLGHVAGQYLAESRFLSRLQSLDVRGNNLGSSGKRALRRRFGPRVRLNRLDLPF